MIVSDEPGGRMHVGMAGPIATADVGHLLDASTAGLPRGYPGAPFLATLITELLARGHTVSAFTLSGDLPLDTGATKVVRGHRFALYLVPMRPRAWPFNGRRVGRIVDLYAFERQGLERVMRSAAPDLVHAHWAYEFAWAALASGLPHVVTCHDSPVLIARMASGPTRSGYRWLRAAMARRVLAHAKHVTAVSPYMRDQIRGWCRVPVAVVPNPIDVRAFASKRNTEPGRARVCMVCNGWNDRKNARAGLRAFARLSEHRPDAELVACGADFGPGEIAESWWLRQELAGRVEFRGSLSHDAVLLLMAESDVLVHPALEESFGAVVAEAMAVGLAVVAGKASGAVPWIVGEAGWLVDVSRPEDIAAALRAALDHDGESDSRLWLGGQGVRQRFSARVVVEAYESRYAAAVAPARERELA